MLNFTYLFAGFLFFLSGITIYKSYLSSQNKFPYSIKLLGFIPLFAGGSYIIGGLGIGMILVNDIEVDLFRYIDWVFTTPVMTYITFKALTKGLNRTNNFNLQVLATMGMILSGFLSLIIENEYWIFFYLLGSLFYFFIVSSWFTIIYEHRKKISKFAKLAVYFNAFLWSIYPIAFLLEKFSTSYSDSSTLDILYTALDISAKIVFIFVIVRSQIVIYNTKQINK